MKLSRLQTVAIHLAIVHSGRAHQLASSFLYHSKSHLTTKSLPSESASQSVSTLALMQSVIMESLLMRRIGDWFSRSLFLTASIMTRLTTSTVTLRSRILALTTRSLLMVSFSSRATPSRSLLSHSHTHPLSTRGTLFATLSAHGLE